MAASLNTRAVLVNRDVVVVSSAFDAALDYKTREPYRALQELCPDGMDVYFDNVGGDLLDAAMLHLLPRARVVISGMISQYNATAPAGRRVASRPANTFWTASRRFRPPCRCCSTAAASAS